MRSVTVLLAGTALLFAPIGVFVRPPEPTPSKIIKARWGEFDLQRSFTIDPVELLLGLAERASLVRNGGSL